jgi:peptidoglycan hydrolase-like protein with peptidoglycan-binding domain
MKRTIVHFIVALCLAGVVRADSIIQSVQEALKNQKVYYGKITGEKNAETAAAIRRYQIRNGLQVTGEVNPETLHSLNINPDSAPSKSAVAQSDNGRAEQNAKLAQNFGNVYHPKQSAKADQNSAARPLSEVDRPFDTNPDYAGAYYNSAPTRTNKRMLIAELQRQLTTQGYYRGAVDGRYGRRTALALRAFQFSSGLPPTGRLDVATLNALGLSDQNITSFESAPRPNQTWIPVTKYKHGRWQAKWKKYQRDEGEEYGDGDAGEYGHAWWNAVGQDE